MNVDKENSGLVPYQGQGVEKRGFRLPSLFRRGKPKSEEDGQTSEYQALLEAIDHSPDPVGTALNGLFKANGIDYEYLERRQLEAGVRMYPRIEEEIEEHLLPEEVMSFTSQFYGRNEIHIKEIQVERMSHYDGGMSSYEPYILIEVETIDRSGSKERKTEQIPSPEGNLIGGRTIHLQPKEQGKWRAFAMLWDSGEVDEKGNPKGKTGVSEVEVDLSLIRSIAKLVPMNPTNSPVLSRSIFITPLN